MSRIADINIILIGFMATGKTALGQRLARRLKMKYVSTDTLVEKMAGMKIPLIFQRFGEDHFRSLETKLLRALGTKKGHVIACGGGIVLRAENRALLKKMGIIIWLKASPEAINDRIRNTSGRPLLNIKDPSVRVKEIRKMLRARSGLYRMTAHFSVDTTKKDLTEAADALQALILKTLG